MSLVKRDGAFWDRFHMDVARRVALLSKDPDRQVGAVLVSHDRRIIATGYNGFPEDVDDTIARLYDKDYKLANMVHAEANCLSHVRLEESLEGATMYVTRFPCCQCATKLESVGITRVVAPRPELGHLRWGESWIRAHTTLDRANIKINYMELEP
jgi:dCMP deaminase